MNLVLLLLLQCIPLIVIYVLVQGYIKRGALEFNQERLYLEILEKENIPATIKTKTNGKPFYNLDKKEINILKGESLKEFAESLHEIGHAKDDVVKPQKDFGPVLNTIFYYYFKFSVIGAVITCLLQSYEMTNTAILTLSWIFIASAVWFYFMILIEEVRASKYALEFSKKYIELDKKETVKFKVTLFNGLMSYILLCLITFELLAFQIMHLL